MYNILLKQYSLLSCNAIKFGETQMFQRNILPPSSGLKSKPCNKPAEAGSKQYVPPKRQTEQYSDTSHNTTFFTVTGVRITNPAI
jgi:hypothetical protein